ncbi:hypothetical protein O6H91_13G044300 [Diphasiastrum complanatum]|uniref:Uncharacterized protein n=1 Tax=Diphasiastrum complanatum TaxID=34168 RepID=A0ACC2BUC7_DIPCM|nr:hypothetical protein O6H91_13G044300 [Diphasiastrum complanatum]
MHQRTSLPSWPKTPRDKPCDLHNSNTAFVICTVSYHLDFRDRYFLEDDGFNGAVDHAKSLTHNLETYTSLRHNSFKSASITSCSIFLKQHWTCVSYKNESSKEHTCKA